MERSVDLLHEAPLVRRQIRRPSGHLSRYSGRKEGRLDAFDFGEPRDSAQDDTLASQAFHERILILPRNLEEILGISAQFGSPLDSLSHNLMLRLAVAAIAVNVLDLFLRHKVLAQRYR